MPKKLNGKNGQLEEKENKPEPPDGGWGWIVVLGAAQINLVNQSIFTNYGLVFGERLKYLAGGRATALTLVMSLNVVVLNMSGLAVGPLLKLLDIRAVNIIGIVFAGAGMIVCSFSSEIWQICLGYSFITGLGLGLLTNGTFLAINNFFTTRKSTAVGLAMAGTTTGQMLMPTLLGFLLKEYGFGMTTFVMGLMCFSGIIGAMCFKPICCCKKWVSKKMEKPNDKDTEKNGEGATLLNEQSQSRIRKISGMLDNSRDMHFKESTIELASSQIFDFKDKKKSWAYKFAHALGLPLLKDLVFVNILLGVGFGSISSISFSTFYPLFLQDEAGFTIMQTTNCLTAVAFADVIGRVTVPEICRKLHLDSRSTYLLGTLFLIFVRSTVVEVSNWTFIFALSFAIGLARCLTVVTQNIILAEHLDKDSLPSAVGLNMVNKAILTFTFGQAIGYLKDVFTYGICIHILDLILVFVLLGFIMEKLIIKLKKKEPKDKAENQDTI